MVISLLRKEIREPAKTPQTDMFSELSAQALPVLAQHVDTSRAQMESGIGALSSQFLDIVQRLDETLRVSASIGGDDDNSITSALNEGPPAPDTGNTGFEGDSCQPLGTGARNPWLVQIHPRAACHGSGYRSDRL
jgi:hypothetical protein